MAGIAGTLVAISIFAIVGLLVLAYLPDLFGGLLDGDLFTATTLKPRVGIDETICDLRIKTNADLVQDINIGVVGIDSYPHVEIKSGESHSYTWFNCVARSQLTSLDLINGEGGRTLLNPQDLQTDIFFTLGEEKVEVAVAIIDASDPTQRVDSQLQSQLSRTITFGSLQAFKTPFNVDVEFVITDIPIREYNLEIYYISPNFIEGINDMEIGEPFKTKICNNFQKFENNRCIPI